MMNSNEFLLRSSFFHSARTFRKHLIGAKVYPTEENPVESMLLLRRLIIDLHVVINS